jgi:hypothetical protein
MNRLVSLVVAILTLAIQAIGAQSADYMEPKQTPCYLPFTWAAALAPTISAENLIPTLLAARARV